MKKAIIKIATLAIIPIIIFLAYYLNCDRVVIVNKAIKDIKINTYSIFARKDKNQPSYEAMTLNTISKTKIDIETKENEIIHKEIKLRKLKANKAIHIYSLKDKKAYKINLTPENLPKYKIKTKPGHTKGYLFTAPMRVSDWSNAIALAIKTNGDLIFYHNNPNYPMKLLFNFQKIKLSNGEVYYSINMESKKGHLTNYFDTEIYLFDKNFNLIKKITSPDGKLCENHIFYMLDRNHYFISQHYPETRYAKEQKRNVKILQDHLKEIKDNDIIFDFDTGKHPEYALKYNLVYLPEWEYMEPFHLNGMLVDPKDNNIIISAGFMSSFVKVDRKTKKPIWILGGKGDMFNLAPEQRFILQHSPMLTSDGYFTFLNNNNQFKIPGDKQFYQPGKAKIVKMKLDEKNLKITDYRTFELEDNIMFLGNLQEMSPNRYLIGYGVSRHKNFAAEKDITQNKDYMTFEIPEYSSYKITHHKTLD
ncbi:MAG: aryl-sulfate sulfotransferase [Candidatus Gastranaerophilales bacterium]|nr:aryl-sulfate sulfotransferase [Candidatus Gastranaerophilales bacterium]